ncbi:spore gernimation protein [Photobacterium kagoshimensis]|uniref:spore gernimation protein n=1 Tax=Photobacterium kagoshimensis TaxID=2910242 RepID=UPI003D0A3D0D
MKLIVKMIVLVSALGSLTACSDNDQLAATPIKNVQNIDVVNNQALDVQCDTGICQFEISTSSHDEITVNMFYDAKRAFEKIEGVSVTGPSGATVRIEGNNQFTLILSGDDEPTKVQVIDYYRN